MANAGPKRKDGPSIRLATSGGGGADGGKFTTGAGGGGGDGPMASREWVEMKIESLETRLGHKIDHLPTRWQLFWIVAGCVITGVGAIVGFQMFAARPIRRRYVSWVADFATNSAAAAND